MNGELAFETISSLAPRLKTGEVDPVALTTQMLTRVRQLNPALKAFNTITG